MRAPTKTITDDYLMRTRSLTKNVINFEHKTVCCEAVENNQSLNSSNENLMNFSAYGDYSVAFLLM